jgi:hypothetical protein
MKIRTAMPVNLLLALGALVPGCDTNTNREPNRGPQPPAAAQPLHSAPAPAAPVPTAASAPRDNQPFGRLSIAELELKIAEAKTGKGKLAIYDNNSLDRYQRSHIPTARWVDYTAIQASDLPKDRDTSLVFYCANEH